jgi:class 3 adenylate cyclase
VPTLSAKERRDLPDRAFAYIDPQGRRRLPINDEGHIRAALGRFNQVDFENEEARSEACKRLLLAARKYGIVPIGFVTRQMRSGVASVPKLPTGPVTLLFTDIEASTALLEMLGDEYIRILEKVRSLLRREVRSRKGVEVDARADEFFAAFARSEDAIKGAIAIQRTLRSQLWPRGTLVRVRAGIHTGSPKIVEGSYVGLPVHTANRICSAAHGGQVLLSEQTAEAIDRRNLKEFSLHDLGRFRLRGIASPHRLFEVNAGGLQRASSPPRDSAAAPV